ncbi:MAG: methyltransferase domain-containing protein [Solirubrobacteraceae bacterium]
MSVVDPDEQRAASRRSWEWAAGAWGRRAARVREWGMPVSTAMIEALVLAPGQRLLELAAGPGDTGFIAAERIAPGGLLINSDGAEAMLAAARARAAELGIDNVEFRQLELEWIDLPAADVDAVLCRWGIMLTVDPAAAAREMRRVLRPGGRLAVAVWDGRERNQWATIPSSALVELGHASPPDPEAPGMFSLAPAQRLAQLLHDAGFTEVEVNAVEVVRNVSGVDEYVAETTEISPSFGPIFRQLDDAEQAEVAARIAAAVAPFTTAGGSLALPGSSLVASATA